MRFFKSFNLRHRRTKSDTFLAQGEPYFPSNDPSVSSDDTGLLLPPFTTVAPTKTSLNLRLLDLGIQNRRLRDANTSWALEYAKVEAILEASREDLLTLRRNYAVADNKNLQQLQASFDNVVAIMTRLGLATLVEEKFQDGQELDMQIINAIHQATVTPGNVWTKVISSLIVFNAPRQYASALRMTLETRKELRKSKKVAKFWKHMAKVNGQHLGVVTPSASSISSVCEPKLTPDRQTALEMLISRRRQYIRDLRPLPHLVDPNLSRPLDIHGRSQLLEPGDKPGLSLHTEPPHFPRLESLATASLRAEVRSGLYNQSFHKRAIRSDPRNEQPLIPTCNTIPPNSTNSASSSLFNNLRPNGLDTTCDSTAPAAPQTPGTFEHLSPVRQSHSMRECNSDNMNYQVDTIVAGSLVRCHKASTLSLSSRKGLYLITSPSYDYDEFHPRAHIGTAASQG